MSTNEPPNTPLSPRRDARRGEICVVLVDLGDERVVAKCLESLHKHTGAQVPIERVAGTVDALNGVLTRCAPADVAILLEPCRVSAGWLDRLAAAARQDTNTASVSALTPAGSELALPLAGAGDFDRLSATLADRTLSLHPRLSRAVGPCIYVRRDAFELVGSLDEKLDLAPALEVDFAQRCLLSGMTHLAADDVLVEPVTPRVTLERPGGELPDATPHDAEQPRPELPAPLRARYPYLEQTPLADSSVLGHALRSAAPPPSRLPVTLDARALDGAITGTQVHVLELILALARTEALALRLLVRAERIDRQTRALLAALPATELLAVETLTDATLSGRSLAPAALANTPKTAVFHRPQQTFSPSDVQLALALGERFVLSQLDLIAYRNPGYFADAATWEDFRAASRHGLSAAERVVVFSEHTRTELLADALVEDDRLRVVPPGLDHRPAGEPQRPDALARTAETEPGFLLCLGTDFRHKNRLFALRLLRALRARHGWEGTLVLAGTHVSPGSSAELERAYLREHPELERAVVALGPVEEAERAWLVTNARALLYPSVYEGFGLVPFESALGGVPCLFAPYASLAE
ncbi:MAG TPA: glycosyltransferase, partial [Solirubrobacteraceae bacterium]|nr:glycosyltransferase [Solirubrobacteraceae bacterium]